MLLTADDALRGKDSLVVEGGTLTLQAAAGDGLKSDGDDGNDSADIDWTRGYIYVRGGTIEITSGDDGLQAFTDTIIAGGTVTVAAADDGVKAEAVVAIGEGHGGDAPTVTVAESEEGIEAGNGALQALIAGTEYVAGNREADSGERLEITGGTITVVAGVDGLDSNGSVTISAGEVDITSADNGGDGPIDGNGTVEVSDGVVTANGSAWDASSAGGMGGGPRGGQLPHGGGHAPDGQEGEAPATP